MKLALKRDLKRLAELAFHRVDACGGVVTEIHGLSAQAKRHPNYPLLETVHLWLLSPFSLWPIDFVGLGRHILKRIRNGKKIDEQIVLLLSFLNTAPRGKEQAAIAAHELQVRTGNYEEVIRAQPKFTGKEEILKDNPIFKKDWRAITSRFDVGKYRNPKGIIRRRMVQERSFRSPGWEFNWRTHKSRFDFVFDAFCHRWVLYGMEGDRPLLQKLSINVTPYGTMIVIPRYWSFDWKRDLKWGAVTRLHRSRGVSRQGDKLSTAEVQRIKEGFKVQDLWERAEASGLRGEARKEWVIEKMGWPAGNDFSRAARLLRLARRYVKDGR